MERQCLELEGRCLVIRDPMEKLGNFGLKNGSVVVVTDKGPGPCSSSSSSRRRRRRRDVPPRARGETVLLMSFRMLHNYYTVDS